LTRRALRARHDQDGGPAHTLRQVRLRKARPTDAAAVAAVHVRSWQAGYRGLVPDEYLDRLRPEDRAPHYTFGDRDPRVPATVVAVDDRAILGFATTGPSPDDERRGELMALYVDPDHWGRGIGRALLQDARARLAADGFAEGRLWAFAGNDRAERFYRSDGWTRDGRRRQAEVWGVTVSEIGYRRTLSRTRAPAPRRAS
jgi:GNAT superfamily N-acetyltransferase